MLSWSLGTGLTLFDSFECIDAELGLVGRQLEQDLDWNSMAR
jgi:hypothetical protein